MDDHLTILKQDVDYVRTTTDGKKTLIDALIVVAAEATTEHRKLHL